MITTRTKVLPVRWNPLTLAHEAWCRDCGQQAYMVTLEALQQLDQRAPFLVRHDCSPACTCSTDPYNCPQGQELVRAIHDRKTAQGDDHVRLAG